MDVNSNGGRRRGPATVNAERRPLVSESPELILTAPPFFLLTTLPVSEAPAGAGMESEDPSSTKCSALPRPLCPPGPLSPPAARGAKAGLGGRGVSSSYWASVRSSSFVHGFPKCVGEEVSGLGLAGVPGRGSESRLVGKFRGCGSETLA